MTSGRRNIFIGMMAGMAVLFLPSCRGIFNDLYDEAPDQTPELIAEGKIYIDASEWEKWHYIDLASPSAENPDSLIARIESFDIPGIGDTAGQPAAERPEEGASGIYTYWYDVYGVGLSRREFRGFTPAAEQPEAESWTIAVHRNNVRTNGGAVAATEYRSVESVPDDQAFLASLQYDEDEWDETNVWTSQEQMLLGMIGNQGIKINKTLSSWLRIDIPPMPPQFTLDNHVFVLRTSEGVYYAIQLEDYRSFTGVKCCLTINYRLL